MADTYGALPHPATASSDDADTSGSAEPGPTVADGSSYTPGSAVAAYTPGPAVAADALDAPGTLGPIVAVDASGTVVADAAGTSGADGPVEPHSVLADTYAAAAHPAKPHSDTARTAEPGSAESGSAVADFATSGSAELGSLVADPGGPVAHAADDRSDPAVDATTTAVVVDTAGGDS